jgi:mono/diheme cytochrome c family protein
VPSHAHPAPGAAAAAQEKVARAQAEEVFAQRCSACHGPDGWGNGPAAASLTTHPRNFHDRTWQASVNDHQIETIIQGGGPSVGKSELMPSNPDLVDQPAVVAALRAKVRAFGSSGSSGQQSSLTPPASTPPG